MGKKGGEERNWSRKGEKKTLKWEAKNGGSWWSVQKNFSLSEHLCVPFSERESLSDEEFYFKHACMYLFIYKPKKATSHLG